MKRARFLVFLTVLMLGLTAAAYAQELGGAQADPSGVVVVEPATQSKAAIIDPAYGTASSIVYTAQILDFMVPNNTVTWSTLVDSSTGISVYQTSGSTVDWWAPVRLPSGALVSSIELEACDSTATGGVNFGMASGASPAGSAANITPYGSTGTAATPGCAFFPLTLTTPVTVDNANNNYWLYVDWAGNFTLSNRVNAVRVIYTLQVSPAPGTATFSDVPTSHMFFQYIEALAAAGITTGYPDGTYGPDNYVTRGQMAVFLSRGFGLHWPN